MANLQQIVSKNLHANAQNLATQYTQDFADTLILQSKAIASNQEADEVQSIHVVRARDFILTSNQSRRTLREILILAGSGLLGVSLQGIPTEYSSQNPRPSWMIFYFIIGFVGLLLTSLGFRKL